MSAVADLGIALGRVAFVMLFILNVGGLLTWVERKQSAIMQDRIGANRASINTIALIVPGRRSAGGLEPAAIVLPKPTVIIPTTVAFAARSATS